MKEAALPHKRSHHFPRATSETESRIDILSYATLFGKTLRENSDERTDTMTSILEEFACGNVPPEPRFFKRGSRYGRAMDALLKDEEKLLAVLNGNEKELFKKYCDTQSEVNRLSGVDRFIYGYRLGVLMTVEVFAGKDNLIVGKEDSQMSKPLLQQLYDGEIYPAEQINPQNPEYRELYRKLSEEKNYFREKFSGREQERFDGMNDLYHTIMTIYGYEDFSYGFRLGAGPMAEALSNRDSGKDE